MMVPRIGLLELFGLGCFGSRQDGPRERAAGGRIVGRWSLAFVLVSLMGSGWVPAWDGPEDNRTDRVRSVPRAGIEVPPQVRENLTKRLGELADAIAAIPPQADGTPHPDVVDVQIFHRAVEVALRDNEFFQESEFDAANRLLDEGMVRAL